MPLHTYPDDCVHPADFPGEIFSAGISIRAWIATQLMQGMLANPDIGTCPHDILAQDACWAADRLIEALNREEE